MVEKENNVTMAMANDLNSILLVILLKVPCLNGTKLKRLEIPLVYLFELKVSLRSAF
jgi:hypothetical protein